MKNVLSVGKRKIGEGYPVFIIAEMSANHKQDIKRAYKIIDAASDAGVDAVKLQTYTPDTHTIDSKKKWFRIGKSNTWTGQTLYDLYKTAYTPWEWQPKLKEYGEKKDVLVFSAPCDTTAVDFLEKMNVKLYKVASFEVVDLELLAYIGQTKKPVIISRGLASIAETKQAIATLKKAGSPAVAVLHCVSSYPAHLEQMNLKTIPDIKKRFKVVAGLSDHSLGTVASLGAVALDASIIEKHFTLSRADGGHDATFSLEPHEMKELVDSIRQLEKALGKISYTPDKRESENLVFRRSLFVIKDIKKGERFTKQNTRCIRPGYGLAPKYLHRIIGKKSCHDIERGTPLSWNMIAKSS